MLMERDIERYTEDYLAHYGFEQVLVEYRRRVVLDQLSAVRPAVVLEIGCGLELLYSHYLRHAAPVGHWVVIEPAPAFCASARQAALPGMTVVEGFLEQSVPAVIAALPRPPDRVICSGVLQEVPSSAAMLKAIHATMDGRSLLHVNVANAASLHRRLALAMNLIPALDTMSERNVLLQQHRVYDFPSLITDMESAGFSVEERGGYLVKPFTHRQMEAIAPALGDAVLDGLFELGRREPELACEIFVNARIVS
ncbi:MAG: methyltransferase domain-containing protein [Gammaproteobacteria bacterium]|nr:methyltransferase domain-containing protein [Gammaproteobacteria bacterium]